MVKSGYGVSFDGITGIAMSVIAGDKSEERLLDDCVSLSPLLSVSRDWDAAGVEIASSSLTRSDVMPIN